MPMSGCRRMAAGQAGYALASVLILLFAMGIIGLAFLGLAGGETRMSQADMMSQRAFWLAEGGKERSLRWMATQFRPPSADTRIFADVAGPTRAAGEYGGSYTVDCLMDSTTMFLATKVFMLDCVGTYRGVQRRIRQRIQMVSFAQYGYFTDDETLPNGNPIWFVTGDAIDGMVHSNGTIRILGNPQFLGRVTSHASSMVGSPSYVVTGPSGWPVGGNNPSFAQGFQLGVATIPLPTQTADLKGEAQTGGLFLPNASDIELGRNVVGAATPGWLRYRNTTPPGPWAEARVSGIGNGILYCNNDVQLSGVLDGELTLGSHQSIRIVDDVLYQGSNAAGAPPAGCNDLLGLVAENNVIYADNTANRTDLRVNAVMMALNTSITAENYNTGSPRGTLTVWGGLIQRLRGPVGTNSGGTIVTGYRKDYHYDPRVTARTPPGFPLTGQYQETAWTETWDATNPF